MLNLTLKKKNVYDRTMLISLGGKTTSHAFKYTIEPIRENFNLC